MQTTCPGLHSAARRPEFEPATYSSLLIEPQNVPEEINSLNWYGKSNTNWFAVHSSQSCSLTPFILLCIFAYLIASDSALMLTLCVLQMLLLWTHAQRCVHVIFCRCFFLFYIFLWPPQLAKRLNVSSRNFHTWQILGAICEPTRSIYSWLSLNYTVGQKMTKFCIFFDPTRTFSALTPERGKISQF